MRIATRDIRIEPRNSRHSLAVSVGERILHRARLVPVEIPRTYAGKRVGVALVTGRRPLPLEVNARLLATGYEVMIHNSGACSIPFEQARAQPKVRGTTA